MNPLFDWLGQPHTQRLGWTLLHFLWQGAAVGLVYAAARAMLHRQSANVRYVAGCVGLLLMAVAPVWTFLSVGGGLFPTGGMVLPPPPSPPLAHVSAAWPASSSAGGADTASGLLTRLAGVANATVPWLTLFWLAGVSVLSLRLSAGWWRVRGWQQEAANAVEGRIQTRLRELEARLGVSRPVRLLCSAAVHVPTLVGWLRPAILLPASTLTGLTPRQLDFILAHELAHVRRGDAWVNLLQTFVETVLFYHPAVWWVSRCVREDREHCCDDLALSVCGDGLAGAQALTALEELRQWSGGLALAASDGSLLGRVRRLLGVTEGRRDWRRTLGSALLGAGCLAVLVGLASMLMARPVFRAACRLIPPRSFTDAGQPSPTSAQVEHDARWLRTEQELVASASVLREVVRRWDLAGRWGLAPQDATHRLRGRLTVSTLGDSYLIEVRVEGHDAQEAADIANAIGEVYIQTRRTRREQAAQEGLQSLRAGVTRWTENVQSRQRLVDELRERLGVRDTADDPSGTPATIEREMASSMAQQITYANAEYILYSTKLEELRRLSTNELRRAILTALPGEEILPKLMVDLATLQQELARLRKDYADDHPNVQKTLSILEACEHQISERLAGMMEGLQKHVLSLKARYDELQNGLDDNKARWISETKNWREFYKAKGELDAEQRIRDALYLRAMQEEIDVQIPSNEFGSLVDRAEPPVRPSSLQPPPWTWLAWGGGLLCSVTGMGFRFLSRRPVADN